VKERTWGNTWRYVFGIAVCLLLTYFPFVRGRRVPLLGLVDLGFHELGHLVTRMLPAVITAAMGSGAQILVPLGIAAYFWFARRDLLAAGLCLAWAGTSARDVAVYIADAPYERLALIGGEHDWAFVLGPAHLNMLDRAGLIAGTVTGFALMLVFAGIVACALGLLGREPPDGLPRDEAAMWRRPPVRFRDLPSNVLRSPSAQKAAEIIELP
jgi:hypothetical protein